MSILAKVSLSLLNRFRGRREDSIIKRVCSPLITETRVPVGLQRHLRPLLGPVLNGDPESTFIYGDGPELYRKANTPQG